MKTLHLVLVGALACWTATASAQSYPVKPIRLIVPTAPGGGTDRIGRLLAQKLTEAMGQQVVVENRGGAGTTIGSAITAKSPSDGYNLLLNHTSLAFNASFYGNLPYDTLNDFAPITRVARQPFLLVVHPSLPAKSVEDLISLAKARPDQIAYGSGGAGSGPYMGAALFKESAKIDMLHVPYKGAGPAFTDLMAGEVQMMIATVSLALPHVKAGRVRALAVTSAKRIAVAPELPTVAEGAIPGYEFSAWYGLFAPAGTPPQIITQLNTETVKILRTPQMQKAFAASGLETLSSSPEEFTAYLKREVQKWAKVVKAVGGGSSSVRIRLRAATYSVDGGVYRVKANSCIFQFPAAASLERKRSCPASAFVSPMLSALCLRGKRKQCDVKRCWRLIPSSLRIL